MVWQRAINQHQACCRSKQSRSLTPIPARASRCCARHSTWTTNGPARNNLGVLLLKQGRLYDAASEFEWARKLMPGHPDPRLNLGLTLEQAGRLDGTLDLYATALEVHPDHVPRCKPRQDSLSDSDA